MLLPFITPDIFNEQTHRQVKLLMRQGKILDIRLDNSFALISSRAITGLQYFLTDKTWSWLFDYLKTGNYEDFGVYPSTTYEINEDFQTQCLLQLIENGENIARIPFLRETQAFVKLRALFKYGKLFFSIRRTDEFMDYLNSKGL